MTLETRVKTDHQDQRKRSGPAEKRSEWMENGMRDGEGKDKTRLGACGNGLYPAP
jgi:hypothetical protein